MPLPPVTRRFRYGTSRRVPEVHVSSRSPRARIPAGLSDQKVPQQVTEVRTASPSPPYASTTFTPIAQVKRQAPCPVARQRSVLVPQVPCLTDRRLARCGWASDTERRCDRSADADRSPSPVQGAGLVNERLTRLLSLSLSCRGVERTADRRRLERRLHVGGFGPHTWRRTRPITNRRR